MEIFTEEKINKTIQDYMNISKSMQDQGNREESLNVITDYLIILKDDRIVNNQNLEDNYNLINTISSELNEYLSNDGFIDYYENETHDAIIEAYQEALTYVPKRKFGDIALDYIGCDMDNLPCYRLSASINGFDHIKDCNLGNVAIQPYFYTPTGEYETDGDIEYQFDIDNYNISVFSSYNFLLPSNTRAFDIEKYKNNAKYWNDFNKKADEEDDYGL